MSSLLPQHERKPMIVRAQTIRNVYEPIRLKDAHTRTVMLEVTGQGTVSFNVQKMPLPSTTIVGAGTIHLSNENKQIFNLQIHNSKIELQGADSWRFKAIVSSKLASMDLLYFKEPTKYIWVSISKNGSCIKVGHGYMLESNVLIKFDPKNDADREYCYEAIKEINTVELGNLWSMPKLIKYWRLPVIRDPPSIIGENTKLASLNVNTAVTADWLPIEVQRLLSSIRNLNPLAADVARWINYSLITPDCCLNEIMANKEKRSNAKTGYIRVGMGLDVGDSVGNPFVLELWPIGRESPIHGHGDAAAVIKVLHGTIEVSLYNPLVKENNDDNPEPIKTAILKKGDITWMSTEFYQTHKLRNISKDTMAATIQCYSYSSADTDHCEQFNYISAIDHKLHGFKPKSDIEYETLLTTIKQEYANEHKATGQDALDIIHNWQQNYLENVIG